MKHAPHTASPRPSVPVDGGKIRSLRKGRGYEIAQFAEMVGCSRAHMANVELGHRTHVGADMFERICDALNVAPRQRWRLKQASERTGPSATCADTDAEQAVA